MTESPSRNLNASRQVKVERWIEDTCEVCQDWVVVEEPMEVRVVHGPTTKRQVRSLSITMRTPGHDAELAAGFLFTESLVSAPWQIEQIELRGVDAAGLATGNIARIHLHPELPLDVMRLQRHFYTTSSCGVCGKASLESLDSQGLFPIDSNAKVSAATMRRLSGALRASQPTFDATGGLHAAGLFRTTGELMVTREDVGRHNAVDKVIGCCFLANRVELDNCVLMVSGRVSFEIMQKALVARIPIVAAVGAPSSLALDLAEKYAMTLFGFTSERRFNVYCGKHRLVQSDEG